ncbi:hypothetical protein NHH03_13790 [Stieleria sp. TO1_6]|uniref:DUF502 domain-containing protein n=1 Tax=Stieleria tagensis TaxID=2956795 RepID=UPI00209B2A79|nr:DUF502 domain-containing protein [Stieleria tagensis]MCO8122815.1 hypothetical protein [Stieleria tagensis]
MREHVDRHFGFLKSIAIGGIVFLLPLIVLGIVLAQVGSVVFTVVTALNEYLGINTAHGYAVVLAAAVAMLILLCFAAGVAAQMTVGKKISGTLEKHLTMIFPRYSIYKDQVAGGIGGDLARDRMKPVLVDVTGITRLALEIERSKDGKLTLYFPGAPDPWSGTIGFVDADRVQAVNIDLGEFMATFERLGRDSQTLLAKTLPGVKALPGASDLSHNVPETNSTTTHPPEVN